MVVWRVMKLILLTGLTLFSFRNAFATTDTEVPFWKKRIELYKKIEKDRAIIVSAKRKSFSDSSSTSSSLSDGDSQWEFSGGGHVRSNLETTWKIIRRYERLSQLKWVFQNVDWNSESQDLKLRIRFLGVDRKLTLHLIEESKDGKCILIFKVIEGFLTSLQGKLQLSPKGAQVTEIGVRANYTGDAPWPGWLFGVGAEAVMHYVASELRSLVEKEKSQL